MAHTSIYHDEVQVVLIEHNVDERGERISVIVSINNVSQKRGGNYLLQSSQCKCGMWCCTKQPYYSFIIIILFIIIYYLLETNPHPLGHPKQPG